MVWTGDFCSKSVSLLLTYLYTVLPICCLDDFLRFDDFLGFLVFENQPPVGELAEGGFVAVAVGVSNM